MNSITLRILLVFQAGLYFFGACTSSQSQTDNQRIGGFSYGSAAYLSRDIFSPIETPDMRFRKFQTNILDTSRLTTLHGEVERKLGDLTILISPEHQRIGVSNLVGDLAQGRKISFTAKRIGILQSGQVPLELWDFGKVLTAEEKQQFAAGIAQEKQRQESAAQAALDKKKQAAAQAALKFNQDAAARGDAYGLLRMGERYRDGDGVEKDLAKSRSYLKRAVTAGSTTAQTALSALPQP